MENTLFAMQFNAIIATISSVICIICLIAIIVVIYISNKWHAVSMGTAITTVATSFMSSIWMGILGNNALFPFINDLHPFIDVYCAPYFGVFMLSNVVNMYSFGMFTLIQALYLSNILPPEHRICSIVFKIPMALFTMISVIFHTATIRSLFGYGLGALVPGVIIYGVNDNQYKQCTLTTKSTPYMLSFIRYFIQGMLLFILIISRTKFIEFTKRNRRNIISIKQNIIKCFLCLSAISVMAKILCWMVFTASGWILVPIYLSLQSISVLIGIHIRIKSDINSLSINLFQDQNDFNDSFITTYIVDRKQSFTNGEIGDVFKKDAVRINDILKMLMNDIPRCITWWIAEYASTVYIPCVECGEYFGFVECFKDYGKKYGVLAGMLDENDDIRYYFQFDFAPSWSQFVGEREPDYLEDKINILCVPCSRIGRNED
eukprot:109590_1